MCIGLLCMCVCVCSCGLWKQGEMGRGWGMGSKSKHSGFSYVLLYLLYNVAIFFLVCTRKSIIELYVFVCAYVCVFVLTMCVCFFAVY